MCIAIGLLQLIAVRYSHRVPSFFTDAFEERRLRGHSYGLFTPIYFSHVCAKPAFTHNEEIIKDTGINIKQIYSGLKLPFKYIKTLFQSTVLGIGIGLVPGAGGSVASFASYFVAKSTSKVKEAFGKGTPEGIVAPESANNSTTGGVLMTTLALGLPATVTTAVLLGALTMQGMVPGPRFIETQGELVYGLILACLLAQILMLFFASGVAMGLTGALSVKTAYLIPILLVFSMVGSFATRNATFDLWVMLIFGFLGYLVKKYRYSIEALLLGLILGPLANQELVRILQIYGSDSLWVFFTRLLSLSMVIIIFIFLTTQLSDMTNTRKPLI
ncbi:tripartite tricarboxylate transporter permease [Salicibibacter cibarius]|nr:tripartite tricarboxylate transporter permease [Salicibibacter cibarius]